MAGGTWLSQNKKRPGAYINFKSVPKSLMTVGDRGIVAMGLPLSWGAEGKLIEVLSSDLIDGTSKKLVGFTAFDSASKLLAGASKLASGMKGNFGVVVAETKEVDEAKLKAVPGVSRVLVIK